MKRAEKQNTMPEKTGTKLKKPAAAKKAPAPTKSIAKKPPAPVVKTAGKAALEPSVKTSQKKTSISGKPKQNAVEKPARKLKSVSSVKDSSVKTSSVKTSLVKVSKAKASAVRPSGEAAAKKAVTPTKAKAPVKISAPAPKGKKPVSGTAPAKEKPAPLKKKTVTAETKTVRNSKSQNPAKISAAESKVKKSATAGSTPSPKKPKIVQPFLEPKPKLKKEKPLPEAAGKKLKPRPKKVEIRVPAKDQKQKLKAAENKAATVIPVTKPKSGEKTAAAGKVTRQNKLLKKGAKKIEKVAIVVPPVTAKPLKKKIKPIGSAVVRGKTRRYDFEVFPLEADLKDGSAIYVISKRITDQRGRGHHKFVCIGQTESLLGEIRKHKKDKCIKQYNANVICLLREESETNRLRIETDLREAHTIACNQK